MLDVGKIETGIQMDSMVHFDDTLELLFIGLQHQNIMSACCTLALASVLLVTAYLSAEYAAYTFWHLYYFFPLLIEFYLNFLQKKPR